MVQTAQKSKNNDNSSYETKTLFEIANQSIILSFNLSTDPNFNKVIITASQFDKSKKASLYMKSFIKKDELRAVMQLILNGNFKNITFANTQNPGRFLLYSGSKNGGTTLKRKNGNLEQVINKGPEARVLQIYWYKGNYYIQMEAYPGKVIGNGAISKAGETIGKMYYKFDNTTIYTTASALINKL